MDIQEYDSELVLLSYNVAAFADEELCIWQILLFSMRGAEMDLPKSGDATSRFLAFVEGLTSVIGHADRAKPLRDYCIGLMMPGERKSVEPMAAITAPERTAAQHQSLLHFVGEGTWSDEKVLAKVREMVLPEIERHGPIEAWIIDDTGFPKKGRHSVGSVVNIAASLVSKTIVRSQLPFQLPIIMRAYRRPIASICRRSGRRTVHVGAKLVCPRRSPSRPSRRSRLSNYAGHVWPAYHVAWC